jgi:hypothetical protein
MYLQEYQKACLESKSVWTFQHNNDQLHLQLKHEPLKWGVSMTSIAAPQLGGLVAGELLESRASVD